MLLQVVGESGLFSPEDISFVHNAGVSAVIFCATVHLSQVQDIYLTDNYFRGQVLVGESLLTQDDPGQAISALYGKELLH
jgi:indole-3-glycerol phosphate synthase